MRSGGAPRLSEHRRLYGKPPAGVKSCPMRPAAPDWSGRIATTRLRSPVTRLVPVVVPGQSGTAIPMVEDGGMVKATRTCTGRQPTETPTKIPV